MKKLLHLVLLVFLFSDAYSQTGMWTWVNGDNYGYSSGNFGIQGVTSPTNTPASLSSVYEWKDLQGNFWLFGGMHVAGGNYADLWKYDPLINEWTWIKGPGAAGSNFSGVFGSKGIPSLLNNPPAIQGGASWVDLQGNFWLFGGIGANNGLHNALWRYNVSTNEWTWMKGSNVSGQTGVYGVQGIPGTNMTPGSRQGCGTAWTDSSGNLWLFGGIMIGSLSYFNDLWRYNIANNEWTWMKGSNTFAQPGVYGMLAVEDPANTPGSRATYTHWVNKSGNLWFFGGNISFPYDSYNDMWRYNPNTNNWAWMSGDSSINSLGSYGNKCLTASSNIPNARSFTQSYWTDKTGNFWFFGGYSNSPNFWNDLWIYSDSTNEWTWVGGDSIPSTIGNFGIKGMPSALNMIKPRRSFAGWIDNWRLYVFGGSGIQNVGVLYNDMWRFDIDTLCVSNLPNTTANLSSSDTVFCEKSCLNFLDLSTNNPSSWQWYFPGAFPDTSTLQNPLSICYNNAGTYSVQLIVCNNYGCDTLLLNDFIKVDSIPFIDIGNDTTICSGDSIQLDAGAGYSSYLWNNSFTSQTINISDSGYYFVNVTSVGCTSSDTIMIVTKMCPASIISILSSDTFFCEKSCINFSDVSVHYPTSWKWHFSGASPDTSTLQNPTNICYNNSGNYDVTLIACNQFGCDTVIFQNFIHVDGMPNINLGNDTLICDNDSLIIDAGSGFSGYLWNNNSTTQTITVLSSGIYAIEITSGNCLAMDTIVVTTQSCASAVASLFSSDSSLCQNNCINFFDLSQNNPTAWQWSFTGAQTSSSTLQNPTNICYSNSGNFDVTLIACNQFGCDTLALQNFISIDSIPKIYLGQDTIICKYDTLVLDAGIGYNSYLWNTNATTQTISVASQGIYTVEVVKGACTATDSISIAIQPCLAPNIWLSCSNTTFCEKNCINFFDLSTNIPTTWQWYFPWASPDTSTLQNPTGICYNTYGNYDVTLIACNANGCDSLHLTNFITCFQNPVDSIYQSNDTLYSLPANSYKWYETSSGIIAGATSQFYVITQLGSYFCVVSDSIGCVASSNTIVITGLTPGPSPGGEGSVVIVPNPNSGKFEIVFSKEYFQSLKLPIKISISNVQNKIVFQSEIKNIKTEIDISKIPNGIYSVSITTNQEIITKRIEVMR